MITDVLLQPDLRLKSGCAAPRVKRNCGNTDSRFACSTQTKDKRQKMTSSEGRNRNRLEVRDVKQKKIWIVKETSFLFTEQVF